MGRQWEERERRNNSQPEQNRISKRMVFRRTVILMLICGVGFFIPLAVQLWNISIRDHNFYQQKAAEQQLMDVAVAAHRGDILDANGEVMAMSATVYNLILAPKDLINSVDKDDFEDEDGKLDQSAYQAEIQRKRDEVADGLCAVRPDLDRADLERRLEKENSQYEVLLTNVEEGEAEAIRAFIEEHKTAYYLYLTPSTKRYYPFSALASQVLGFVNTEGGVYGLEAGYEDVLKGIPGRVVTGKTAKNVEMYNSYSNYIDAVNGYDLTLTLDSTIQAYAEQAIETGIQAYDVRNGGFCVVMDPKTGAILAMASSPEFDPNSYSAVTDSLLQGEIQADIPGFYEQLKAENAQKPAEEQQTDAELQEQAAAQATAKARETQWRNKAIREPYEPGSTFKALVLAAALEEGVVNMNTTFTCTGSIHVEGWGKAINCSKRAGHGTQTLKVATGNSCNPAFVTMGLKIGTEAYYRYLKSFGLMETTGIDLPGEVEGIFANEDSFNSNVVSLAAYSFGQTFNVTPLELIRAQAATINGGYLYTPYLVEQVLDDEGNILSQHETTAVRQVISEETSAKVRECLEWVVSDGGGRNGQVTGYRIGGKTGTADKTGTKDVVVSFMCFAPADDPQYIMLLTMDTPSRTTGTAVFGGTMVAPVASQIMSEILPLLGVEPDYTAEELVGADTTVPNVVGQTREAAEDRLADLGFTFRTVGDGDTVTDQTPAGGAIVPGNASIILYLGQEKPDTPCTVPNVVGKSASEANKAITNAGLIMKVTGTTTASSGNVYAITQSLPAGTEVAAGTVVTVQFGDNSVLD